MADPLGADAALAIVGRLDLGHYHLFHAIRADLLGRAGRAAEAIVAYDAAIACADNRAEREFLRHKRGRLAQ